MEPLPRPQTPVQVSHRRKGYRPMWVCLMMLYTGIVSSALTALVVGPWSPIWSHWDRSGRSNLAPQVQKRPSTKQFRSEPSTRSFLPLPRHPQTSPREHVTVKAYKEIHTRLTSGTIKGVKSRALLIARFFSTINREISRKALLLAASEDLGTAKWAFRELSDAFSLSHDGTPRTPPPSRAPIKL